MEKIFHIQFPLKNELYFIAPLMFLNALGIFIGRFLRFNSWDVLTNPFSLIIDIADVLLNPNNYIMAWGMIGCYAVLMTFMYLTIKKISKPIL